MNLFRPILGLGFLAGAAIAAVKLVQMFDRIQDGEWTAVMGEMPEPEYTVPAPGAEEKEAGEGAPEAEPAQEAAPGETAAVEAESAAPETAPEAETKAPERVTVHPRRARIDPTTIACAEDFQDWDDFGCRG